MASLIHEPQRPRKPWRVAWHDRGANRTRRFPTKREAERFVGELARGREPASARQSLAEWIPTWIRLLGPAWAPRTLADRARFADDLILPSLGHLRLERIHRTEVLAFRAWVLERGRAPYTANRAVQVLSAALGAALEAGLIEANPCAGLKPLRVTRRPRIAAEPAQVEAIRDACVHPRDRAMVSLMAYAGLRPSEVYALAWADVGERVLTVRSSADERTGAVQGTKTGSVRSVPINPVLAADLAQLGRFGPLVIGADPSANTRGRETLNPRNWRRRSFDPAAVAAGCPQVSPYMLRHHFASAQIAGGANVLQVAALMGHADATMVLCTYGHLFLEAQIGDEPHARPRVTAR